MLRRRFHISFHSTFTEASAAKSKLQEESPDRVLQIRKNAKGFKLVERLPTREAEVIKESRYGPKHQPHDGKSRRTGVPVL